MLMPPHNHWSYFVANGSVPAGFGAQWGTAVTSGGSANTYTSTPVQLHAGLTYPSQMVVLNFHGLETSADVISATTLNCYFDIGIGPSSGSVTWIAEKLGASNMQGIGCTYILPLRIPPDTAIWCRHQNTQASAKAGVVISVYGGNMNPGTFPTISKVIPLGATSASTTGTTVTPASATEDAWTEIVASTTDDYAGFCVSPLFNVDTSLTAKVSSTDLGVGSAGNEIVIAENITLEHVIGTGEQKSAVCMFTLYGAAADSRICTRTAGDVTADSSGSQIVYGFMH